MCLPRCVSDLLLPRALRWWLVALFWLHPFSGGGQGEGRALWSQESPAVASRSTPATRRLADGTFDQRQRAMWDLWADRPANREAVSLAISDPDPEISSRAEWIWERWRRGILADTPAGATRQLESSSLPDAVPKLLDMGLFSGALVAIEEAITAGDQAVLSRASTALRLGFPFHIRLADEQDRLAELAELIDRLASGGDWFVSRNQLWQQLNKGPERFPDQAAGAGLAAGELEAGSAVIALMAAGRDDEAKAIAEELSLRAGGAEWIRKCLIWGRSWDELGRREAQAAADAADNSERDRHWAFALVAAARSGDRELRERAVAALAYRVGDESDDAENDPVVRLRWQVLAMHGEIEAAVAILSPSRPLIAAELLAQAGRVEQAFAILGWEPEETDTAVATLIAEAKEAMRDWQPTPRDVPPALDRLLSVARLLHQVGRRDAAWEALSEVVRPEEQGVRPETQPMTRAFVMQAMLRMNRPDWLVDLVSQQESVALSNTDRYFLTRPYDVQGETFDALLNGLGQVIPSDDQRLLRAAVDFLDGRVPAGFDAANDYRRLYEWLVGQTPAPRFRQSRPPRPTVRLTSDFPRLFESHGQIELAKTSRLHLASMGDQEAILELAESELKAGRGQSARGLFQAVWKRLDRERRQPERLHLADESASIAMRAILGEAIAATRLGDAEGATELWRLIDLMMTSPSAKLRNTFATLLVEQGFEERAERIYRDSLAWILLGTEDRVDFYGAARDYHRSLVRRDPGWAADMLDLALVGTIESSVFYPAAYVSLPGLVHRQRVMQTVESGDVERVRADIDAILRLNPIDIDFGEKVIKRIREAGWEPLADETIERIFVAGDRHLQRFPLDVTTANNLAWILALSNHRLDEAESLSRRTVWLTPDSSVYRDTFAEILFRQGRVEEAIAIAEACLIDRPGEWHLHEQLRRFRGEPAVE